MPGGRPPKPGTAEEKAIARRERVRQHVQAHRLRKRLQNSFKVVEAAGAKPMQKQPMQSESMQSLPMQDQPPEANCDASQRPGSPSYLTDVARLSQKARIDLSFGFLPAVVHDFDAVTGARFPWSLAVQQLQPADRIVDLAVLAAGARTLARIHDDAVMAEFARVVYQQTLRYFRAWLERRGQGFDLLLTTVPLALMAFESGDGSSRLLGSPWAAHASGCASMMVSAGPEAYQSELGLIFLRGQRWVPHSIALMQRKPCFLEDETWRSIPFKCQPKNREDLLWEALVLAPRILQLVDDLDYELLHELDSYYSTANVLYKGILKAQNELRSWMQSLNESSTDGSAYREVPVAAWFKKTLPNLFETSFQFRDFFEADWTLMHWTSLLNLHISADTASKMLRRAGHIDLANKFDRVAGPRSVHERIAYNICQSIEFCIGPDPTVILGTVSACHRPLQRAFTYFMSDESRYAKEIQWCNAVEAIVVKRGPHVKGYLKDAVSSNMAPK